MWDKEPFDSIDRKDRDKLIKLVGERTDFMAKHYVSMKSDYKNSDDDIVKEYNFLGMAHVAYETYKVGLFNYSLEELIPNFKELVLYYEENHDERCFWCDIFKETIPLPF